jgi:excinuclease ABC B subunit
MSRASFDLQAPFQPAGDQPRAIAELTAGLERGDRFQTLLGVTGSGKTMSVAHVIANHGLPALVLSHNKTLAAQLYGELKGFFPRNAVEYFISYYDYYQPEAYVPTTDTYIEKDASINEDIDRLRLRATSSLMERQDVVIVATVSAIYGLGDPIEYREQMVMLETGQKIARNTILRQLVAIQYSRNDVAFERGTFRVRGDTVEILPAYEEQGVRVELWGDEIERISKINALTGETIAVLDRTGIYPAKHFITNRPSLERAVSAIRMELADRLGVLRNSGKLLEAQRLESRTNFDVEMMLEIGTCAGIENYSRHISGRKPGERPACLLDYFPADFLVVVDESHVTLPGGAVGHAEGEGADRHEVVLGGQRPAPRREQGRQLALVEVAEVDGRRGGHRGSWLGRRVAGLPESGFSTILSKNGGRHAEAGRQRSPAGGDPPRRSGCVRPTRRARHRPHPRRRGDGRRPLEPLPLLPGQADAGARPAARDARRGGSVLRRGGVGTGASPGASRALLPRPDRDVRGVERDGTAALRAAFQ